MCGIVGWLDWERDISRENTIIENMTKQLNLRGPDAEGFWYSKNAVFGHRRLSVVDPEGGKQPMRRLSGEYEYVITYNGELYNTKELRDELEKLGYTFYTSSDTEVLLVSYIEWGR